MKKTHFTLVVLLVTALCMGLSGCDKDDDVEGIEVKLSNYLEDELILLNEDSVFMKNGYWQSSAVELYITPMNNFWRIGHFAG